MMRVIRRVFTVVSFLSVCSVCYSYSSGDGTAIHPYQIATVADWQQLMGTTSHWSKHFILTADVNLAGVSLTPVGNSSTNFTGVFDGNGHKILNVVINLPGSNYTGLFGWFGQGGKIRNFGVENVNITGNFVGGLVGRNYYGMVISCYSTGAVNGSSDNADYAGGLVGFNNGTVSSCYSTGAVSKSGDVGGLVGFNSGTVSSCYSTGAVSRGGYAGGLAGVNSGTVSSCFWDMDTSGQAVGVGYNFYGTVTNVLGRITEQMQTQSTFTDYGWDFVGETANGTEDTWRLRCEGMNYPKLAWQVIPAADFVCPDDVSVEDLMYFACRWLRDDCTEPNNCDGADINIDGRVNIIDFGGLSADWSIRPPAPVLVAHWKFDETEGLTAFDSSGYQHDGTLTNGPVWTSSGSLDGALQFDGVDDYVQVAGYKGITGTASRSVTAWIRKADSTTTGGIIEWGGGAVGDKWEIRITTAQDVVVEVGNGYVRGKTAVGDGNWHHIAVVFAEDGTPMVSDIKLYVDGTLDGTYAIVDRSINTVAGIDVQIGRSTLNPDFARYFNGTIDDVRIYDGALTGYQIRAVILESPRPEPTAHWKFDETEGDTAFDSSGYERNGTLINGPVWTSVGSLDGALQFDGVNDYVQVASYKGITGTAARSVTAWIKTGAAAGPERPIVAWGTGTIGNRWCFRLKEDATFGVSVYGGNISTTGTYNDGQWHLVAAVLSIVGSPRLADIMLYVDGVVQDVTITNDPAINTASGGDVVIGSRQEGSPYSYFNGTIDDVRLYTIALTEQQVCDIMSGQ